MSTNKTEHLNLHRWTLDDHVKMSEVNENFAALDENAETTWAQLTAQSAAIAAEAAGLAAAVERVAALEPLTLHILTGTYTGDGTFGRAITLGVAPKIVFVSGWIANGQGDGWALLWPGAANVYLGTSYVTANTIVSIVDDGFATASDTYLFNQSGYTYQYIVLY